MHGIDYESPQKLPTSYKLILLDIFNEMYATNNYPNSWRDSYIHFINKPDGTNVRPISLNSCVCKLFESLIKNKLQYWVEIKNILPKSQMGFRKGQCTIDNLANLTLHVEESLGNKKDVLSAFLDVCGAFDNVNIYILISKLAELGCPVN